MRAEDLFNAFDELDAELLYDAHAKPQRKQSVMRRMAIAASLVILTVAAFVIYGLFAAPASYIYLDSSESMTVTLNAHGRVLSVKADSDSYEKLNGQPFDEAAAVLIADMVGSGSISRDENTLIVGADRLSPQDREALDAAVTGALARCDFDTAVISMTCHADSADRSPSVSRIIDLLCEHDRSLDRRSLSRLNATDLALLWGGGGLSDPDISVSGEASDAGHIGFDKAAAKALSLSAFAQADIDDVRLSYSVYHGHLIYVVRLTCGDRSEAYFIHAETGATEQALRTSSAQIDEIVGQEIRDSADPEPAAPSDAPSAPPSTVYQAQPTVPPTQAPTQAPTQPLTQPQSDLYTTAAITMRELSFVVQTVPESAGKADAETLFEGQCFHIRSGEKQNTGAVSLITTYAALQRYFADHAYPYADRDGMSPIGAVDEDYFRDHSIIAVAGVFSDASYYACLTDIRTDGSDAYLEVSLSYGESRSGEYYCRALSLYGVEKDLISSTDNISIY